jgi:fumarate reductase subunit C
MSALSSQVRLWYWQRMSAAVLAACTLIHLGIIIYAVRGGLSAAQILGRTQGSIAFGLFYASFVLACAVHVPIGLARMLQETLDWSDRLVWTVAGLFGALLLVTGLVAVYGVVRT